MKIIVSGTIGQSGLGGQAWALMHYLLGLRSLGHEVYYLEDCGDYSYVYDWQTNTKKFELEVPAGDVQSCLAPIGLGEQWLYRAGDDAVGMPVEDFRAICSEAD